MARSVETRLERLEQMVAEKDKPPGRVYLVSGGARGDDVTTFVHSQGYIVDDDADWVIHLLAVPADSPPLPMMVTPPPYPAARRRDSVNG